jgi:HEAT repeat protein
MQDARARLTLLAACSLLMACAGCQIAEMKPGAKSIFEVFKQPTPAEAAAWSIDPYDPDKRYQGTLLLANAPFANEPVYIKVFTDNSRDVDPGVRAAAIRGIANHGSPDLVPLLVEHMNDPDVSVRIESGRGLQRLHNPVAITRMITSPLFGSGSGKWVMVTGPLNDS